MTPPKRDQDDEDTELTAEDIAWVRLQRRQHEHEKWLRGQIKILWPWAVAVVSLLVALGNAALSLAKWASDHVKL